MEQTVEEIAMLLCKTYEMCDTDGTDSGKIMAESLRKSMLKIYKQYYKDYSLVIKR